MRPLAPRRLRAALLPAAALTLSVAACGGDDPPRPTSIQLSPTTVVLASLGQTQQVTATVLDQKGNPMNDVVPLWTTATPAVASVSPTGLVTAIGNGSAQVTATANAASASVTISVAQVATVAVINGGNGQSSPIGAAVPVRPAVRLTDALGNGVVGTPVTFTVTGGGGTVSGGTAVTDGTGVATVGSWILGPNLGANSLQAAVAGLPPLTFTATGILDPCSTGGAPEITVGQTINGILTNTDCQVGETTRYDLFRLTLAAPTAVVIHMTANFDSYLKLFNAAGTLLAEHDDVVPGVNQDARIAMQLAAGDFFIRARSFDVGQFGNYSLSVTLAQPGVPAEIRVNGGNRQVVAPNTAVPTPPSVVVRDQLGAPVAGAAVTFATVPGFGSLTGASATTDANGIATVGSWTVAAGTNVLAATVASSLTVTGSPAMFAANGNASTAGFNIELKFRGLPTVSQFTAFRNAVARWETIITNDLPDQSLVLTPGQCSTIDGLNETIDDLAINVILEAIDGAGGILGSAGPCAIRSTGSRNTILGTMRFDTADLDNLESSGRLEAVILHEMGHVLGIGTLWNINGLLVNPSLPSSPGVDTRFSGANAIAGFDAIGGSTYTLGGKVPVENTQGGSGTRDAHWRESVLQNELMTGFLNAGANPMSLLTVRSLQDIGFTVNTAAAESFFVATSLVDATQPRAGIDLGDDIERGPLFEIGPSGRPIGTLPPRKKR